MKSRFLSCGAFALLFAFAGGAAAQDQGKKIPRPRIDFDMYKRLFGMDPPTSEVDNPSTPEKVALGKALYHEKRLSAGGDVSCASCHDLASYGVDGKETSAGTGGKANERNTPTTWNAFRQFRQGWDGRFATIEELAVPHVLTASTHGLADEAQLVAKLKEKAELADAFKKAFPGDGDPVTAANFGLAIGAFARTLVTKSKWEEFIGGNQRAFSNEEVLGLKTFVDSQCTTCHSLRLLGGHMYQKLGLLKPYASHDVGRMAVTKSESDKSFFKVPSLLNVEKTGPWLHDGKAKTLEDAVTIMADIQLDKKLTPEQVSALVAFLKTMTSPLPGDGDAKKAEPADAKKPAEPK